MPGTLRATARSVRDILLACAAILAFAAGSAASAGDDTAWPVHGNLLGKKGKNSKDVSGIACARPQGFPRSCVVIDDNVQQAQFVTVKDGKIITGDVIPLIYNKFKRKALELDGEGIAYADEFYYVIGSHGHPRDSHHKLDPKEDEEEIAARIAASSQIVRFRVTNGHAALPAERTGKLKEVIAREPALAPFLDRRLENNGLTIEGIAIRRGSILVGFRGPSLSDGRAAVLSVPVDSVFGGASLDARLRRLPLGEGRGVRDLATYGDGVLVLAGPTANGPGPYAIYWWDGETEDVRLLKELADIVGKKGKRKAEALLPLDEGASGLRVLILFDGEKKGAPVPVTIPQP